MRRTRYIWSMVILSLSLQGCVHHRSIYLSNGQRGYSISCGTFTRGWTSCLTMAGHLCGNRGYSVSYSDEIEGRLLVGCKQQVQP
jgi:hypothetical protein